MSTNKQVLSGAAKTGMQSAPEVEEKNKDGKEGGLISDEAWADIAAIRKRWNVPGMSVGVVHVHDDHSSKGQADGEVVEMEAGGPHGDAQGENSASRQEIRNFGVASVNERGEDVPVTSETLFSIASNTKLFTVLAIDILIRDGAEYTCTRSHSANRVGTSEVKAKLRWDTKIGDVFPEWADVVAGTAGDGDGDGDGDGEDTKHEDRRDLEEATIEDLASMRLGFPDHINAIRAAPPGYILPVLASLNRTKSLRQTLQYQNAACILLHHLINTLLPLNNADEEAERNGTETDEKEDTAAPPMTLDQLVRTRLFVPLKMTQTYYNHLDALQSGKMADNWLSVGDDPDKCSRDWREKSANASDGKSDNAGPPKSCMGEMMPAGWCLDEGDDGLHLAGWAGVISCSEDVLKFLTHLLSPSPVGVPPSTLQKIQSPHSIFDGRPPPHPELSTISYSLGQMLCTYRSYPVVYHTGMLSGHVSFLLRLPGIARDSGDSEHSGKNGAEDGEGTGEGHEGRGGWGISVLLNGGYMRQEVMKLIAWRLVDDILGLDPVDWEGRLVHRLTDGDLRVVPLFPPAEDQDHDQGQDDSTTKRLDEETKTFTDVSALVARKYTHRAYGPLLVTPFDPTSKSHEILSRDLPKHPTANTNTTLIAHMPWSLILPWIVFVRKQGDMWIAYTPKRRPRRRFYVTNWAVRPDGEDERGDGSGCTDLAPVPELTPHMYGPWKAIIRDDRLGMGSNFFRVMPPFKYIPGEVLEQRESSNCLTGSLDTEGFGVDVWFERG